MTSRGYTVNMCDRGKDLCVSDYMLQQCSVILCDGVAQGEGLSLFLFMFIFYKLIQTTQYHKS